MNNKSHRFEIATSLAILLIIVSMPSSKQKEANIPFIGMGGTANLNYPYNEIINSFREWDHYHEPGTGGSGSLPAHRFWTWAKMDRYIEFPVGQCMGGTWLQPHSQGTLDAIFECDKILIDNVIYNYPGAMHQVGNEPNWYPMISPESYSYQYRKYEQYIKSIDSSSKMMNGGIMLATGWQPWVSQFISTYQSTYGVLPPVDIWVIHPYAPGWPNGILAANNGIAEMIEFRRFLDSRGYENTPILIGEFSDANGFNSILELSKYAQIFCNWLVINYRGYKIIGWYWWGSSVNGMGNAGLFNKGKITTVGEAYINYCGIKPIFVYFPITKNENR